MTSMTRHLGAVLIATASLWTAARAAAICTKDPNGHCSYDCDCDCGFVCNTTVPSQCVLAQTNPFQTGHCDPMLATNTCACQVGLGNTTMSQTCCPSGSTTCTPFTCTPTWQALEEGGYIIPPDAGPIMPPVCQYDIDCGCGNHCLPNPFDGGTMCISFFDAGGAQGGMCNCSSNIVCVDSTCGCPMQTCTCDSNNCDGGGIGVCHPGDAGPVNTDAGPECHVDIDCDGGCGVQVCSHAVPNFVCVSPSSGDPGFCQSNLDCNCPSQTCNTNINSCVTPMADSGPMDSGHPMPDSGHTTGGTTGGTTGSTSGSSSSGGCGSTGSGAAGLGVLALVFMALLLSRRRQPAGRP
jgi:uncharacterized protein (TIGR03382 family)